MNHKKLGFNLLKKVSKLSGKTTLILATLLCSALPAHAVNFNFTYSDDTTNDQKEAFEMAGSMWGELLQDDVTVNIHVDFADNNKMPTNVLGGAIPGFYSSRTNGERTGYNAYSQALINDSKTDNDKTTLFRKNALDGTAKEWRYDYEYTDNPGIRVGSDNISLTRANAKAVGMIDAHDSDLDAVILMNKLDDVGYGWNSNYLAENVGTNNFDLTSVAMHEIGHALGFVSTMDYYDSSNYYDYSGRKDTFTPFDIFRNTEVRTWRYIDLTQDSNSYFSLDAGVTALGRLSTGQDTDILGDGYQASHWSAFDGEEDLMDPTLPTNRRRTASYKDLTALDVIGWDANYDALNINDLITLSNSAKSQAVNAVISNPTSRLEKMFNQFGWGSTSTTSNPYRQDMDLADFLAQEGLFQRGAFWSQIEPEKASVPEPSSILGFLGLGLFMKGCSRKRKS